MKIYFDKNSLEISRVKTITAVISIMPDNNIFFPEKNWNDNIIIILSTWIVNVMYIVKDGYNEAEFVFFDGPFSFKITRGNSEYTIALFEDSEQVMNHSMDFREFVYNLVKLTQEILTEAKERGWESKDLKELELAVKKVVPYFDC